LSDAASDAVAGDARPPEGAAPTERSRLRREVTIAACVGCGCVLLLVAAYLAAVVPGRWFPRVNDIAWPASALKLVDGTGTLDHGALVISASGANTTTLVSLDTDIRSADYPGVQWIVRGIPDGADVRLLWKSDVATRRTNLAQGVVEAGLLRPFVLARDPAWLGHITGLALAIRAPLGAPMRIEGVVARPFGALDFIRARVGEWTAFEPFNGASINTLAGGADSQDLPLPAFAAAAVALAALVLVLLRRFAPRIYSLGTACTIGGLFVVAWLVVDVRWALNLARQTRVAYATYGGKSAEARHRAAEDGALYLFVERALAIMPKPPVRVFVASDEHYFRGRAAWHLYPHNVEFTPFQNVVAPPEWMKPGDWLVVYHRHNIQYDAARKLLRWDGNAPVHADLKLLEANGAALFEID
jgi:hypothetical protein